MTRARLIIVCFGVVVGGCSSRARLSIAPCMTPPEVAAISEGFDTEPDYYDSGEGKWLLGVWQEVELRDGTETLVRVERADVNLRTYEDRVGEIAVRPVGNEAFFPLAATRARLGPLIERALGAGFVRVQGDVDQFLISEPGGPLLRALELRRGDYVLAIALEVTESQAEATASYYGASAERCRSPEMLKWLSEHKVPPPEELDVVWPGDKKPPAVEPSPVPDPPPP